MLFQQPAIFSLIVEFEDVDAHGVVHHPNYLKYLEKARSSGIRKCGYSLEKLLSSGSGLLISEIHAKYLRPALLEQELFVISQISDIGKSSIKINQSITLQLPNKEEIEMAENQIFSLAETIFWAKIRLVCINIKSARAKSIPQEFRQVIKNFNQDLFANFTQGIDTRIEHSN